MQSSPSSPITKIALGTAAAIVVSNMVGTGVFTSLGFQVGSLPSGFVIMVLWAVGGICAMCGALCYAELAAAIPRSGGEYHLLGATLHPAFGFMAGWLSATVGFAAPIALAAMALGQYAHGAFPGASEHVFLIVAPSWMPSLSVTTAQLLGLAIVGLVTAIHLFGLRFGGAFQNVATAGKLLMILFLLGAGFFFFHGEPQPVRFLPATGDFSLITSGPFAVSLIYVMYSYTGWNAATYIVGEIRDPGRTLPRAIIGGTGLVILLYLGLNAVFLHTTPVRELVGQVEIGLVAGHHIFGEAGGNIVGGFICLGLVASISAMTWVGPRVIATMGEDLGALRIFSHRNGCGAPDRALLLQLLIVGALIVTSTFETVLVFIQFALTLSSFLVVVGFCLLRWRRPDLSRPFRAPLFPLTPLVFLGISGWMLWHIAADKPRESFAGLATLGAGLVVYFLSPKRSAPDVIHPHST